MEDLGKEFKKANEEYGNKPQKIVEHMRTYESSRINELERAFPEFVTNKDNNQDLYLGQSALGRWWDRVIHFGDVSVGPSFDYYKGLNNKTREELGNMLVPKVNRQAVNNWEHGRVKTIKRSHIQQMAEIFDVSPVELMCRSRRKTILLFCIPG